MNAKSEIVDEIKALSLHYPKRQLAAADLFRWLEDFANDLSAYSPADVRTVCAMWRQGEGHPQRMATPAELASMCRKLVDPARLPAPKVEPQRIDRAQRLKVDVRGVLRSLGSLRNMARRPGETEVDYGRRMWPTREQPYSGGEFAPTPPRPAFAMDDDAPAFDLSKVPVSRSAGVVDAGGITPTLRALVERQRADAVRQKAAAHKGD